MKSSAPVGLSIGELCRKAGVRPSAVRYYEERGLLPAPMRRSGRRVYDLQAVKRLGALIEARRLGFVIRELAELANADSAGLRAAAETRAKALRASMARLTAAADRLDALAACACTRPDECLIGSPGTTASAVDQALEQ